MDLKVYSARDFVDGLPYIGEYFQPDDRVYLKKDVDAVLSEKESENNRLRQVLNIMPMRTIIGFSVLVVIMTILLLAFQYQKIMAIRQKPPFVPPWRRRNNEQNQY